MREIPLTKGKIALVSDRDYRELMQWKWTAYKNGRNWYALRCEMFNGKQRSVRMHRQILGLTTGDGVKSDHRDCNGLNNQRRNLRRATHTQNMQNSRMRLRNPIGLKGVIKTHHCVNRWSAVIRVSGRLIRLGCSFRSPQAAHRAYCRAAKKYHGRFGRIE